MYMTTLVLVFIKGIHNSIKGRHDTTQKIVSSHHTKNETV